MNTDNIRIAMAQINCIVGDFGGNAQKILENVSKASELDADIIAFPELAITGYPPEDLLLRPGFIEDNIAELKKIARSVNDIIVITGFIRKDGGRIFNSAAVLYDGGIRCVYDKSILPNYGVFDEKRYFSPGNSIFVCKAGPVRFGLTICEDIWHADGPHTLEAAMGARLIINISASPFYMKKISERESMIRNAAKKSKVFVAYVNMIGGQDEIVFDGQSMITDNKGAIIAKAKAFQEDILISDIKIGRSKRVNKRNIAVITNNIPRKKKFNIDIKMPRLHSLISEVYDALKLGLRDYVIKNGFSKVVIGLSGGIDSALVAAIAADALGSENVTGIFMPTRYSSGQSASDAKKLAQGLNIDFFSIPIDHIYRLYLLSFETIFAGKDRDTTEENLQARIRGNILMAVSNKFGSLVLTTGNKSEMSVGYATLYGDMAGGLAVIKDVPKTLVYELVKYRNSLSNIIPDTIINREPTAELRYGQKDTDALPPYEILDPIIKAYIEEDRSIEDIIRLGFKKEIVKKVISMIDRSEYKRRQSPPGIKITPKAFGRDRRMPITNKYG